MNKNIKYLLFFVILFFPLKVFAAYDAVISGNDVRIRTGPGTNNSIIATVNSNTSITLDDKTLYDGTGCSAKWYKINYNGTAGYVCSSYVSFVNTSYSGINVVNWNARVNSNNVTIRTGASTSNSAKATLTLGANVTILNTVSGGSSGCPSAKWHQISYYSNDTGYICTNYVTSKTDIINTTITEEYKTYLKEQGFPESYWPFLNKLHTLHPNWVFKSGNTGAVFSTAVNSENNKCYMQTTNDNYRTSSTPAEGSSWFRVNTGVIAFYMDPRNWLTEDRIFMFEKLDYSSELESQYPTLVKAIFGSGALSDDKYTTPMINAGKTNKISPVHIASRIRLEVGANGSDSTNGKEFTWKGQKYSGYYNFFNIGAYEETIDGVKYSAVTRGLAYAAKLVDRSGNLWNNIETSVTEGSSFLANGYVTKGQGTIFYQKFNVGPNAYYPKYTHQYMTNIQAPATEGSSSYNSYRNANVLDQVFIFEIPVYSSMPDYTSLPNSGNTNNYLSSLSVEGYSLSPEFDEDVVTYESYVPKGTTKVNVKATVAASSSSISGTGEYTLTSNENIINVIVKSEAGEEKKYVITVKIAESSVSMDKILESVPAKISGTDMTRIKNNTSISSIQSIMIRNGATSVTFKDKSGNVVSGSTIIGTGFTITIVSGSESKTYSMSVNGDTSGDGKITILDLLQVLKQINGDAKLSGSSLLAADTSGDAKVTILDLLQVLKHINGDASL